MRRLIVCCDGTWQGLAQDSNVARLHAAIVPADGDPAPLYVPGVGVSRNPLSVLSAGLTGAGLSRSITTGYRWLVQQFRPGDRIAVFGFSRGAYTARSLAGMIGRVGLLDGAGLGPDELDDAVDRAYTRYRTIRRAPDDTSWSAGLEFVGVWDTVGALGIPSYVGIPDLGGLRHWYEFLDVVLNPFIPHARQAVSLDEMRGPFRPTLWRDVAPGQDVAQVWFPGDHGDVGGSYRDKRLGDGALDWMMREATAAIGLAFDRGRIPGFRPDPEGKLHGDRHGPVGAVLEVATQPRPRATPRVDLRRPEPDVDASAYARQQATGYRATRTLAAPGDAATVVVQAAEPWNATGLYLEPGRYAFEAAGEWHSAGGTCGPGGEEAGWHCSGSTVSELIGVVQSGLRALLRNPDAGVLGARRVPEQPWMSLLSLVANEVGDAAGRTTHPDELVPVGTGTTATVTRPGYLYAFANDAWGFYGNNGGAVELTVTHVEDPVEDPVEEAAEDAAEDEAG